MNEILNLVEILKDAPKGTKLWSPICGECELDKIDTRDTVCNYAIYCLAVNDHSPVRFAANGKYTLCYDDGECVLFPSKENRDWSTFKVSKEHKHFEPYQKVLVKKYCDDKYMWFPDYYCFYDISSNIHYILGTGWAKDEDIIPYEGNEDKVGKVVA